MRKQGERTRQIINEISFVFVRFVVFFFLFYFIFSGACDESTRNTSYSVADWRERRYPLSQQNIYVLTEMNGKFDAFHSFEHNRSNWNPSDSPITKSSSESKTYSCRHDEKKATTIRAHHFQRATMGNEVNEIMFLAAWRTSGRPKKPIRLESVNISSAELECVLCNVMNIVCIDGYLT